MGEFCIAMLGKSGGSLRVNGCFDISMPKKSLNCLPGAFRVSGNTPMKQLDGYYSTIPIPSIFMEDHVNLNITLL